MALPWIAGWVAGFHVMQCTIWSARDVVEWYSCERYMTRGTREMLRMPL